MFYFCLWAKISRVMIMLLRKAWVSRAGPVTGLVRWRNLVRFCFDNFFAMFSLV